MFSSCREQYVSSAMRGSGDSLGCIYVPSLSISALHTLHLSHSHLTSYDVQIFSVRKFFWKTGLYLAFWYYKTQLLDQRFTFFHHLHIICLQINCETGVRHILL